MPKFFLKPYNFVDRFSYVHLNNFNNNNNNNNNNNDKVTKEHRKVSGER